MIHDYSMYVIEDAEQCVLAGKKEIYDFTINGTECQNCLMAVGPYDDVFLPCVILVGHNEDEAWPVCIECAAPLLYPREWVIELDL